MLKGAVHTYAWRPYHLFILSALLSPFPEETFDETNGKVAKGFSNILVHESKGKIRIT